MNKFFGSKFNTILLLVLIVLMIFALKAMYGNKELYLHPFTRVENTVPKMLSRQISGHTADLVSFSVSPGEKVSGVLDFTGTVKNNYFFEANIVVNILDNNKKLLKQGHASSTTDWMTSGPVSFAGSIDLSGLPQGLAYIEIANDNPSGLPENSKSIYIPIVIK